MLTALKTLVAPLSIPSLPLMIWMALAVFALPPTTSATAQSDGKTLIIAGLETPPYMFLSEDGEPKGLLVDIVRSAAMKAKIQVTFLVTNWPRAQLETQNGRADLIFPVVHTPERETWLSYPRKPITRFKMSVFARADTDLTFSGDMAAFHDLRIGKISGGRMHPKFRELEESGRAKIIPRDSLKQLVQAVHHDRLDVFVAPELMTLWTAHNLELETVRPFQTPVGISDIYLAFSRRSGKEGLWNRLQAVLPTLDDPKAMFLASLKDRSSPATQ